MRKAGRKLGRSPAAISRALAFLEAHVGVTLLHRTTRSFKLSEAGERYAIVCRRVISDLEEADLVAAGERSAPRGTLTITAPVAAGEDVLRSFLDAFMDAYPTVSVRLLLLDRPVSLIDEGIDIALRIAHLTISHTWRSGWRGSARRSGIASLFVQASENRTARRSCKTQDHCDDPLRNRFRSFRPVKGSSIPRSVQFSPRFVVNSVRSAVASAVEGRGITRLFSYHVAEHLSQGTLQILLADDRALGGAPPFHLSTRSACRSEGPRIRRFRRASPQGALLARLASDAPRQQRGIRPRREKVSSD